MVLLIKKVIFLHRFSKLESLIRIFAIVMKFLGKLLDKINVRKYDLQFDNVHLFMGQSSFYLSYQIMQLKFPNRECTPIESKSEGNIIITKNDYNIAFFAFVRELQMYLTPELFMELQTQRFSTSLPHFKGIVLFLDNFGLLRVLTRLNSKCEVINWKFINENMYKSKLFIPANDISKTFAVKLILKVHMNHSCCGITYLVQCVNESYFIPNLTRLCKHVVNTCFKCQKHRLVERRRYVPSETFTYPKDYILNLDVDKISYEINSVWQIDIIPRLNMRNSTYTFVDKNAVKNMMGCPKPEFIIIF